ncbi:hypothetical protein J31TS4_00220 [Paenibacillus sp. J31TS4]|nr:hypothetical protein J31TS4_00220 [Paenibacillus sp. J31TS4]
MRAGAAAAGDPPEMRGRQAHFEQTRNKVIVMRRVSESSPGTQVFTREGFKMKFYTIKLPKFLGGFVKAVLNTFSKN